MLRAYYTVARTTSSSLLRNSTGAAVNPGLFGLVTIERMVEDKEIISTAAAGGLALSGLVLVFAGFSQSQLSALLDKGQNVRHANRIRLLRAILGLALITVILGLTTSGVGMIWLLGSAGTYDLTVGFFFAMLVLTVLLAITAMGLVFA